MHTPPPVQPLPDGDLVGRQFIIFDTFANGEVHATAIERSRDGAPLWRLRLDEGIQPGLDVWIGPRGISHLGRWLVVRAADHPVDVLFRQMAAVAPYPEGTEPVAARIVGTAFFPGGSGLWRHPGRGALPPLPMGGVMIIGQDFHSRTRYVRSLERGAEDLDAPTWRGIRATLRAAGISEAACFFTNAYMGLRSTGGSVGQYSGANDPGFVTRCQAFLMAQLQMQRPRAIVTLGLPAARMLGALAPNTLDVWTSARGFHEIDAAGAALVRDVAFPGSNVVANTVALVHPSFGRLNINRRRYQRDGGDELSSSAAEVALLREAIGSVASNRRF